MFCSISISVGVNQSTFISWSRRNLTVCLTFTLPIIKAVINFHFHQFNGFGQCTFTSIRQHSDNLVPGRFGAFELVVKCGEMRLLRLSLLSSHQAARTESESAEGAWQRDRGTLSGRIFKVGRGVKNIGSWGTDGVEENTKLKNRSGRLHQVGGESDKHVTYFRSLALLLERQSLVWVLILSCKGVQVIWCSFYIMLQKANHAWILWDVMDQKLFSFFCIDLFPFLKLCKNVQKKYPFAYI